MSNLLFTPTTKAAGHAPVISLVAAVSRNGVIGREGGLPWRLRDDMAHFVRTTMGHPVLMGRKTYESIPPKFRPLPERVNIVITRNDSWEQEGVTTASSLEEAIAISGKGAELMVAGGGNIYAQAMPIAHRLHLTEIHADIEGDTYFPPVSPAEWKEVSRQPHAEGEWTYDWVIYERI